MRDIPFILLGVLLNASAQLLIKTGMMKVSSFDVRPSAIAFEAAKVVFQPYNFAGLLCYVVSVGIWMYVLSRAEVSFAYPFLSVGYVVVAVAGHLFFGENLSFYRIAGIATICVGVILISKSA